MTPAGKRDQRIVIERFSEVPDEYGEPIPTWAPFGKPQKAKVFYGLGDERRQAAREEGAQSATFNCHATETTRAVQVKDRIVMGADNWDIVGISPITRRDIDFTAKRAVQ